MGRVLAKIAENSSRVFEELPRTLIDEGGGAAGAEEAADERFRRDTASKTMQELRKTADQTLEKEQPAELLRPKKCVDSRKTEKRN